MTRGDNLIGIPTIYKGIQMRSKLESKVAMFLDSLKIRWVYEPSTFLLSNGIPYRPDFYLPELKMWLEVKGNILEHNKDVSILFVEDNKTELLMISPTKNMWFSVKENGDDGVWTDQDIQIGFCSKCNHNFFCSNLGSYHCRSCGYHDGDHDLVSSINSFGEEDIDFSDVESIKGWLHARKTSI